MPRKKIKLITLDLDDTVWPNHKVILDAEKNNLIEPNGICVEGTFGNTGIGLTLVNNARGYKTVIVMPNITVPSKRDILRNMGAELHLVDPKPFSDPGNYQRVSERLASLSDTL